MRIKPLCLLLVAAFYLVPFAMSQTTAADNPAVLNRAFANNGHVRMQLGGGDYTITASSEEKIHVDWSTSHSSPTRARTWV